MFQSKRIQHVYSHTLDANASQIFPLLCPVREYDWIDGWACDMVYSNSGVAENNCIFTTDFPEEGKEVWVITRYEKNRAIEFVRVSQEMTATKLDISLLEAEDRGTTLVWTYTTTGLSHSGNERLEAKTKAAFQGKMAHLDAMLRHFLETGKKLTLAR